MSQLMHHCGLTLDYVPTLIILFMYVYTGGGQNNGNTKKLNRICVGYTENTSVGNTGSSSLYLHSVELVPVH
jgi:hypothetical protein